MELTEELALTGVTVRLGVPMCRFIVLLHPGRQFDQRHWISLGSGPGITTRLIIDAVENSYDLVVERLPRRDRPGARRAS